MALNRVVLFLDEETIQQITKFGGTNNYGNFDKSAREVINLGLASGTATPVLSDAVTAEIAEFAAGNGISYELALAHVVANGLANIEEANTL